jgi:1-phosphofructokinase family hexose kinase
MRTLVVGPNLSIDSTVAVPRLDLGRIHRIPAILKLAGGKGANLARALRILGEEPLLVGFAGGPAGEQLRAYLTADGITHRLVPIAGETRACFSISDEATGAQTEFYESGPLVTAEEVRALLAAIEDGFDGVDWMALTGSLPRGVPGDFYAQVIVLARRRGVRTLLDAKEEALAAGVAARPDVLKINRDELEELAGISLPAAPGAVADAAAGVVALEAGATAIITLAAGGAVVVARDGRWHIIPPAGLPVMSPVGSGDAAAGGILAGFARGEVLLAAACLGVAAGTAGALHLGGSRFTRAEAERLAAGGTVTEL